MSLNRLRLIGAICAARLLFWVVAPFMLLRQFLVIVRGVALVALILTAQALWTLRAPIVLTAVLAGFLLVTRP